MVNWMDPAVLAKCGMVFNNLSHCTYLFLSYVLGGLDLTYFV
jgi:hypothetical protein